MEPNDMITLREEENVAIWQLKDYIPIRRGDAPSRRMRLDSGVCADSFSLVKSR